MSCALFGQICKACRQSVRAAMKHITDHFLNDADKLNMTSLELSDLLIDT